MCKDRESRLQCGFECLCELVLVTGKDEDKRLGDDDYEKDPPFPEER